MTQIVDKSTNLESALAYLKRGFSVFPVHAPSMPRDGLSDRDIGKMPLVKWNAYQERRPSEATVRQWWKQWPDANIGLATGVVSGVFMVDADGMEAVNWIAELCGGLPETLAAFTQRGQHFYFRHPGSVVRNGAHIAPKVDIRGDGGYAVIPPSVHASGFVYEWADHQQIMESPEWLLTILQEREHKAGHLAKHELAELLKGVPDGRRHDSVVRLAGHWIGLGLRLEEVNALCLAWNQANKPPSPDDHISQRVLSIWEEHHRKRKHNPEGPIYVRQGDDFVFTWTQYGIQIELKYLKEISDGLQGEITILHTPTGRILHWGRLKLASTSQREELAKRLAKTRVADTNWSDLLGQLGRVSTGEYRLGSPTVELRPSRAPATRDFISKLMPEKATTVIFGDGGTGKSTISLAIAVAVAAGRSLPNGLQPIERASVLYLDWESCLEEHADRLAALLKGLGIPAKDIEGMIHYRAMARPLSEDLPGIKAEVSRLGAGLVIVDSYVPAAGLEPEGSEAAQRMMNALRELSPATNLVITHINRADARENNGHARAYGSVFVQNLPRSVWHLKRSESEDQDLVLGLYHKKVNRGRLQQPFGFRIAYEDDAVTIQSEDISRNEDLRGGGTRSFALRGVLKDGPKTLKEIVAEAGGSEASVQRALYRMDDAEYQDGKWRLVSGREEPL